MGETKIKKNEEYIVDIIDNGFAGEGIAKIEGFTIFVPNAIKGEKVKILIVKVLSSHAFAKILGIIKKSDDRIELDCATYKRCGGCSLRHVKYEETLKMKQNSVQNLVNKTLDNKVEVEDVLGMDNPYYYRNKVQFPVGINKEGKPQIGVFANRTHEIIPVENCLIQDQKAQEIAKRLFEYWIENDNSVYDEINRQGCLRHIVVKMGKKTNEYMCIIVVNSNNIGNKLENDLIRFLTQVFPEVKTIIINSNIKNTNVILGDKNKVIYGNGFITDILGGYKFKISPYSFYQVNPIQAEKLYEIAVKGANISKDDVVFDLYCGIGTISLFMAKYAKKVYGVEIVDEAIKMARENAIINDVKNVEFLTGDTKDVLHDLIGNKNIIPDVVMFDPPRKGLDKHSVDNILGIKPKRVVYISCNPATLVRDLHFFEDDYVVRFIKPVDMFPFTSHVEVCALLELKNCQ